VDELQHLGPSALGRFYSVGTARNRSLRGANVTVIAEWKADVRDLLDRLSVAFKERYGCPLERNDNYVSEPEMNFDADAVGSMVRERLRQVLPDF
jgi:hypothetical protein